MNNPSTNFPVPRASCTVEDTYMLLPKGSIRQLSLRGAGKGTFPSCIHLIEDRGIFLVGLQSVDLGTLICLTTVHRTRPKHRSICFSILDSSHAEIFSRCLAFHSCWRDSLSFTLVFPSWYWSFQQRLILNTKTNVFLRLEWPAKYTIHCWKRNVGNCFSSNTSSLPQSP